MEEVKRIFITSYRKSGTHQIMPMFVPLVHLVDRSNNNARHLPDFFDVPKTWRVPEKSVTTLRSFHDRGFGHFTYLPEYAEAVQAKPTKVLFNVRDPRDVIVSEFETAHRDYVNSEKKGSNDFWSTWNSLERHRIFSGPDPIAELIEVSAARWPAWLGWLDHDFVMKVKYEDLRLKRHSTIGKIRTFCQPYKRLSSALCMERASAPNKHNPTFRKGKVGEWKKYFKPHHRTMVENLMGEIFEKLGYEL